MILAFLNAIAGLLLLFNWWDYGQRSCVAHSIYSVRNQTYGCAALVTGLAKGRDRDHADLRMIEGK